MKQLVGMIVAAALLVLGMTAPVYADTNNFQITNFEADYYLDRDADNRSTLKTVEKITAAFPQADQNHGIERALPTTYDGHSTSLQVVSVTDEQGNKRPYTTYESNGNEVLRIGDKTAFAHGLNTYVITYTQRDVTKNFAGKDEFYWDVNGTEWQQPFDKVSAQIHLSESLASALTGDTACYRGVAGASERCTLSSSGSVLSTQVSSLGTGENVTFAIGFKSGTFAEYQPSVTEKLMQLWFLSLIVTSAVGFGVMIWLAVRYAGWSNRKKDLGTVVPEYLPPKNINLLIAEQIGEGARAVLTAQIIDLAVRHYLRLYQTREKSTFKSPEYELEIIKPIDDLQVEEKEFIETLFGENNIAVGSRFEMKKLRSDYKLAGKLSKNTAQITKRIKGEYALRGKDETKSGWFKRAAIILLIAGILTLSPVVLVAAIVAAICTVTLRPLTDAGLAVRRYLAGLKLYISVAEKERLAMLQSPEGAEKTQMTAAEPRQLVKLYERVLPYAVLFGQEKEWNKQLGEYYQQSSTDPDWYSGHAAFNAAMFASAMNDFSTTTNSYAASTSSSSSGSSGGGTSGGGGGGGGGGGW